MRHDPSSTNPAAPETPGKHPDDVIVVPRGSSRSRFIMTALLAVLVLTTFTVSGEVVDVFTGQNRAKDAYMTWKRPDGTVEEITEGDFVIKKRNMAKAMDLLSGGRNPSDHDETATAHHILADELAIEAGVAVTDEEMSKIILQVFGTAETYKRRLADLRTSAKEFEETLRSILRVRRYEMLLAQGFAQPDPKDIEEHWKEAHQEYSIETIDLPAEGFTAQAEAACPAGADLQAWYDALSDVLKSSYRRPIEAKTAAEFVWFSIDPLTKTEKLLAKYPRPASENPDEVARTWYETNKDLLYVKADLPPGKLREPGDYKAFEEVAEDARTAAIAYQSLLDWFSDMKLREEAGEKAPLHEEGSSLGLAYRQEIVPHTLAEWSAAGMAFRGRAPILATFEPTAEPERLLPEVFVDSKGLFVGRLLSKEASRVPEFAEIQDKVREGWIRRKKGELAKAKLDELAAKLPAEPDPSAPDTQIRIEPDGAEFRAAAQELGLEVKTEDWFDVGDMPEPGQNTPFRQFVRGTASRYGKTLGTLSPHVLSPDQSSAWMARIAAKRDPDLAGMTPLEYESARQLATKKARDNFLKNTFLSDDFLKEHYALDLEIWRRQKEESSGTSQ